MSAFPPNIWRCAKSQPHLGVSSSSRGNGALIGCLTSQGSKCEQHSSGTTAFALYAGLARHRRVAVAERTAEGVPKEMPATRTALSAAPCGPMSRPSAAPPQRANAPVPKSASARYSPGEGAIKSGCSRLWQQRWEILFQFIKDFGINDLGNVLLSLYQNSKGGMKCAGVV